MSHQPKRAGGGKGGGQASFTLPEFKSKWLSCSFCTFFQSALSGKIFQIKNPFLWTAKRPLLGPEDGRGAGCGGNFKLYLPKIRSRSEDASTPLSILQVINFIVRAFNSFMKGSWIPPSLKIHGPEQWRFHQKCEISTQKTHVKNL